METIQITMVAGEEHGAANDDIPPIEARRLVKRLEQRLPLAGAGRVYLLYEDGLLGINGRRGTGAEQVLRLGFVEPDPRSSWRTSRTLWAAALAATAVAIVSGRLDAGYDWLVPATIAVACVAVAALRTRRVIRFVTVDAAAPVLELVAAVPEARSFSIFLSQLRLSIEHARHDVERGCGGIAAAVAEHRRLMEIGVLSEKRYESAKARLLRRYNAGGDSAAPAVVA